MSPAMVMMIDDIAALLAATDVKKILDEFYHQGKGSDPVIHFYETFLAEYDPKTREKRGVYYTPEPVVSFIVRSVDLILKDKERFDKKDGLADDTVTILDPAAGTMTFIAEALKLAVSEYRDKYGSGNVGKFIKEHFLNDETTDRIEGNFFAFELMMAPYVIGHIKISFLLEELGYTVEDNERFNLYLTNTLEFDEKRESRLPGIVGTLSREAEKAYRVKKDQPILVIMGNPPYSVNSSNSDPWIKDLLKDGKTGYYMVDGKPLKEKKILLQDDYVKFIRFAQWKIEQRSEGILAFITNHGYLNNPTFRGMRQSLINTFDEMYFLDLHGNIGRKEKCPDGSKDENVFDIKRGVVIALFIKTKTAPEKKKIFYSELWGLRESKYEYLLINDYQTTNYKEITPNTPYYFFVNQDDTGKDEFYSYPGITDIFPVNVTGIGTSRDSFVIDMNYDSLLSRMMQFKDLSIPSNIFDVKETPVWQIKKAREKMSKKNDIQNDMCKILYRPFDIRHIYYSDDIIHRTRGNTMRGMLSDNLGIISVRQVAEGVFNHAIITDTIVDSRVTFSSKGTSYLFPLYIYPDEISRQDSLHSNNNGKRVNINTRLYEQLKATYKKDITPEEILYYIYGVLYSDTYRDKYRELLKINFPRIPFTEDYNTFIKIGELGKELADLHLLKSPVLDEPVSKYEGAGNNLVEYVKYDPEGKRIFINGAQHFTNISPEVHSYMIGGYQVSEKWLKDRKGRLLSSEEIKTYCRIITALANTHSIQNEIEDVFNNTRGVK